MKGKTINNLDIPWKLVQLKINLYFSTLQLSTRFWYICVLTIGFITLQLNE